MLLMIDNYDSFTYNLVQYFAELGADVVVRRNDEITVEQIEELNPQHIVISPGPCTPNEAGVSVAAIKRFAGKIPMLGVCLGHQSIGQAFGGRIIHAKQLMHGKTSLIHHNGQQRIHRPAEPVHRDALSLAGDRARNAAGLPGGHRMDRRRRDHGRAPQDAGGAWRAVPSGIHPDRAWARPAEELSEREEVIMMTPQQALVRLIDQREIFYDEMLSLMRQIMSGEVTPAQIAGILVGLRVKKETIGEISAAAFVMREFAAKVPVANRAHLVDTCGTGGDAAHTFNISTASALVAAAAGAHVAKHGGRSVSSTCGSRGRAGKTRRQPQPDAGTGRRSASTRSASASCSRPTFTAR